MINKQRICKDFFLDVSEIVEIILMTLLLAPNLVVYIDSCVTD